MRAFAGESLPSRGRPTESESAAEPEVERTAEPAGEAVEPTEAVEPPPTEPGAEQEIEQRAELTIEQPAAEPETVEAQAAEEESVGSQSHRPSSAPHVLIVGGGAIAGALAHDLALRGLRVTVVEKGELASGSTGRGQGVLHSGARFAIANRSLAIDCAAENKILRRIAPGSFEENDGLHVAVTDEDADFAPRFLEACWQAAVPAQRLTREQALRSEPGLNPELRFAVRVPDATMDTMRLPLRFFATARSNGADVRHFTEVVAVDVVSGGSSAAVTGVRVRDRTADREYEIGADLVVNATGPWAGRVAALVGVAVAPALSGGAMAAVRGRHTNMVVSRLHVPGDADVVVPDRRSTTLGIVRAPVERPNETPPTAESIEAIRREAALLVPALAGAPVRARWTALLPVASPELDADLASPPLLIDHARGRRPILGFVTIAGGPTTTMRATAQAGADLICARLGVDRPCETAETTLLPHTAWYSR